MRTIAAVTVARSDWGIYRPVLNHIQQDPDLQLNVIAAGAHLCADHGTTLDEITADGFDIVDNIDMLLLADTPAAVAKSMGLGTIGFAQAFHRCRPDILLVLGDRFEMHAAALAAVPFQIPIAHIHGGEVTHGAIDDAFRHAITKYSHLHFPSTSEHARRIEQLGEEPWRITISGAPALDNLRMMPLLDRAELERRVGLSLQQPPLMLTFHPVTLQFEQTEQQIGEVLAGLEVFAGPIVISRPNADPGNAVIVQMLEDFCRRRPETVLFQNLGTQAYFSLMNESLAMVGNSSSGIIEAASFGLPVVNIGLRQAGRPRSANIIDVDCNADAIRRAIRQATTSEFRRRCQSLPNIYGDGTASEKIVGRLKAEPLNERLMLKQFRDLPADLNSQRESQRRRVAA
ncbi:MAG: UDP-N-acetylglucosamine 2-epimerase [Planctomycetaceae bacterium]